MFHRYDGYDAVAKSSPVEKWIETSHEAWNPAILLDNAVKYTPGGGRGTMRIVEEDGSVGVEVADTGIGIPEDQIPHVFERFYRAEEARSTEGLGLGLSIARQIAEDHRGSIEVRRKLGEGSTFIIRIPRSKA